MTPLQARICIRTLREKKEITQDEFNNIENMLTSSDKENHVMAMNIIEFKKKDKVRKDLELITDGVEFDIMNVDPEYLMQLSQGALGNQRDQLFEIYLASIPDSNSDKARILDLLGSDDQESTYIGEQIIITKIRELQNSKLPRSSFYS